MNSNKLYHNFGLFRFSLIAPAINKTHSFKSRMCSSCGNKYNKQRSTSIFSKLFKCKHRHVVFTIPDELRVYFK